MAASPKKLEGVPAKLVRRVNATLANKRKNRGERNAEIAHLIEALGRNWSHLFATRNHGLPHDIAERVRNHNERASS